MPYSNQKSQKGQKPNLIELISKFLKCFPWELKNLPTQPHNLERVQDHLSANYLIFQTNYRDREGKICRPIKFGRLALKSAEELFVYGGYLGILFPFLNHIFHFIHNP